ncbi:MAG: PAS domain S-box protein [Methanoregula sp.]|nr:PAS domain S-box protein [Methanoregula sp.]
MKKGSIPETKTDLSEPCRYFESLFDNATGPIIIWDRQCRILRFNCAFERLTGMNALDITGQSLEILLPEKSRRVSMNLIQKATSGHPLAGVEIPILRKNGDLRTVLWNLTPLCEKNGSAVVATIAQGVDITERVRAGNPRVLARDELETRVRDRTMELKSAIDSLGTERCRLFDVLETLPVYVCLLDKDYRMPFANKYFRESFGEAKGSRCYEALFSRDKPCETCETYTVMKTGKPHHWFWTGPNGRDYDIYDFPFTDSDGSGMILEMGIDITERKKAEEERAALASIVEHSDDAIIGKSLDGVIVSWNAGAGKMYGYSAQEAIGRHISMLVPPDQEDDLEFILDKIRNGDPVFHYDTVRMRKDGQSIQVSLTISPIKDRAGTLMGASTIARNITERKKSEEALEKANAYNRSLIEANPDPLVTINPNGTISDVNEATIRVTGFSRDELVGTDFSDYFTEPARAKAGCENVFRDGSVNDYELEIRNRDGRVTPVLYNATVFRSAAGNIIGVFASARDITERKKSKDALEKANAYNRSLIEASLDPLVTINPDGIISDVNEATIRVTGFSRGELVGTDFSDYFTDKKKAKAGYERAFHDGTVTDYELEIRNRDGHVIPVLYNATVYRGTAGNVVGVFASARDITERKTAEMELRNAHDLLEKRVEERTQELVQSNASLRTEIEERRKVESTLRETSQYLENLINYANAPIIVWDPQFRITLFNRAFEYLTDWTAEEVNGKPFDILLPGKCQAEVMDLIRKTVTGERWEAVEIPILQKTGKIRTVLWNSAPIYDFSGKKIVSIIAQGQDITDRKRMERENRLRSVELGKMNAQLKEEISQREEAESLVKKTVSELLAAIESTADGIYVVDRAGRVIRYNQNFASMWKVPDTLLESGEDHKVSGYLKTLVKNPGLFHDLDDKHVNFKDRETYDMLELNDGRIFERYSKPQKMDSLIIGRVMSFRDVTDRRRAEEKLIASLQEKETLIREIHHRVKNNLQIISGLLDMTRMRTPDPTTNGILTDMMMKIKTMAQIHTRLYESKQFDKINMGSQIRDQVTDLSTIYGRSGTEIENEIDAEDIYLPVDQAIPCALVVNEILSNAFKHAFPGKKSGKLSVSAMQADGVICITVRDDGVGFPEDVDVYRTTSLGLKLIRNLVMQLNGSVTITGTHGTEVIVKFPLHS